LSEFRLKFVVFVEKLQLSVLPTFSIQEAAGFLCLSISAD